MIAVTTLLGGLDAHQRLSQRLLLPAVVSDCDRLSSCSIVVFSDLCVLLLVETWCVKLCMHM